MGTAADVETTLRGWLADGTLAPEQRLPSERTLIEQLGASRNTVRAALAKLIADGNVRSEHGRGYFVCQPRRSDPVVERWKVRSSEIVVEGRSFDVERRDLRSPAGRRRQAYVLRAPRTVTTAVISEDGRLLLVWRQRDATSEGSWELPAEVVEGDEDPALAAARSVRAAANVKPTVLHHVIEFQPLADVADALQVLFVGSAQAVAQEQTDEARGQVAEWIPLSELPQLVERRKVTGAATLLAILAVISRESSDVQRSLKRVNLLHSGS
ncbi:transcriptional regulator, GntR family [Catenulispora acidiphila DSM 44928]|uniref:Transcriptional regulator, GntR family n=1 Tax=Catenulispora acidiphila (strain DSM 44928 / JCM 14897 / NBRC 102108 / NRRL B-24433 / ID139908) TaxID=479433 RepID=C7Q089_CATAD|nr:GntR family transcriptional regulator [Catenulispora acidiphila]ACU77422.1 transcriptional regulator, GntR family [Catenulispora acidiphila DSM 44928]